MEITRWIPIRAWMPALKKPRAASVDRGSWALFILLARTECPRDLSKSQDRDLVQGLQQLPPWPGLLVMKCAHPGRSLLATAMATPPHPAPLEKLRTACLLMGFSLAQSPVFRYQGGGSSKGREPGDSSHSQALPCLWVCFQVGSKVPFILKMCPPLTLLGKGTGLESPVCCTPTFC